MKRTFIFIVLAMAVGGLSGGLCAKYAMAQEQRTAPEVKRESSLTPNRTATLQNQTKWPDFTYAAENSVEAVVHVASIYPRRQETVTSILEYYFGYRSPEERRPAVGAGSGVILTTDGYIVTNNHVIDKASDIQVTLYDKHKFPAKLIGTDPVTDVAVLKIDTDGLPFLPFGNSDSLRLGEWVLAIGNPYNLNSTITAGIVSAKGRHMLSPDGRFKIESFIQTDAAVNPGNSGGALVNTRGELVGINTAIASPTGSFSGYSFAVPTAIVQKVVEDIIQHGAVQRAVLGIVMTDITDDIAKKMNLANLDGVFVVNIIAGSAAEKAGIRKEDVITHINGVAVKNTSAVQEQIGRYRPEEQVEIIVERNGKKQYVNVVLEGAKNQQKFYNDPNEKFYNNNQ
ncbi:MAG: trypsin-like peptidase domain-containing protein [Prevotellaceae bacterium]|jgi:Do/DeqQ family serine protease|nr:trypsin-like peptidase domain-containing protein [Prevotellaceae bacterium]